MFVRGATWDHVLQPVRWSPAASPRACWAATETETTAVEPVNKAAYYWLGSAASLLHAWQMHFVLPKTLRTSVEPD